MRSSEILAIAALVYAAIAPAASSELPAQVGQCIESRVAGITTDFPGAPGGGSVIHYENGSQQLSFDKSPEIESSQIGDPVRICLLRVAANCPPGDERGRTYQGTNLRTGTSWTAPDTLLHDCSGA